LRAEEKIAEYLDVCSYSNLYENLEKLKLILLNNYQMFSFEYLKNRNSSDILRENNNDKLLDTVQYFKQKLNESNINESDKNLLENFRKEFAELILTEIHDISKWIKIFLKINLMSFSKNNEN